MQTGSALHSHPASVHRTRPLHSHPASVHRTRPRLWFSASLTPRICVPYTSAPLAVAWSKKNPDTGAALNLTPGPKPALRRARAGLQGCNLVFQSLKSHLTDGRFKFEFVRWLRRACQGLSARVAKQAKANGSQTKSRTLHPARLGGLRCGGVRPSSTLAPLVQCRSGARLGGLRCGARGFTTSRNRTVCSPRGCTWSRKRAVIHFGVGIFLDFFFVRRSGTTRTPRGACV